MTCLARERRQSMVSPALSLLLLSLTTAAASSTLKMAPCNASDPTQRWGFYLFDNSLHAGDAMDDNRTLDCGKCTNGSVPTLQPREAVKRDEEQVWTMIGVDHFRLSSDSTAGGCLAVDGSGGGIHLAVPCNASSHRQSWAFINGSGTQGPNGLLASDSSAGCVSWK